jgi:quercetin dioxygenase-like cupin family protein
MRVVHLAEARPYLAPKHYDMRSLRLQGFDASDAKNFWVGLSHFLPGGGAERDVTPVEKVYVVLSGEVTVITDNGEQVLAPYDSCHLAANEARAVENRTNMCASMLVVMPYPPKA